MLGDFNNYDVSRFAIGCENIRVTILHFSCLSNKYGYIQRSNSLVNYLVNSQFLNPYANKVKEGDCHK